FGLENAMKMKGAQMRLLGQFIQGGWRLRRFNLPTGARDQFCALSGRSGLVCAGTPAGPITCVLSIGRRIKKLDVFAPGKAGRGTGAAIDARCLDGIDKMRIGQWVSMLHRFPALIFRNKASWISC